MPDTLVQTICKQACRTNIPDGSTLQTLTSAQIAQLAMQHGVSGRNVEITALKTGIIPLRYLRNMHSFTCEDQLRLLASQVTVVGLGGLGGTMVEILARAGVGAMNLVDGDVFEDHNLNRQLLSSHAGLGVSKADIAGQRVRAVNASVEVTVHPTFFTPGNGPQLVAHSQVVVDCLDSIGARFDLEAAARNAGLPLVSAAVAGAAGHVTTIFPEDTGLQLIYGPPSELKETKGAETHLGCLPQGVFTIAAIESAEVIKVLLGQKTGTLQNRLLVVDLNTNEFDVVNLM
jgi:molybdopterin/thiamine biosynthesis adenylyltransferase